MRACTGHVVDRNSVAPGQGQLGAADAPCLGEYVRQVLLYRIDGDMKLAGDFAVTETFGYQIGDLRLSLGKCLTIRHRLVASEVLLKQRRELTSQLTQDGPFQTSRDVFFEGHHKILGANDPRVNADGDCVDDVMASPEALDDETLRLARTFQLTHRHDPMRPESSLHACET